MIDGPVRSTSSSRSARALFCSFQFSVGGPGKVAFCHHLCDFVGIELCFVLYVVRYGEADGEVQII